MEFKLKWSLKIFYFVTDTILSGTYVWILTALTYTYVVQDFFYVRPDSYRFKIIVNGWFTQKHSEITSLLCYFKTKYTLIVRSSSPVLGIFFYFCDQYLTKHLVKRQYCLLSSHHRGFINNIDGIPRWLIA